MAGGATAEGSPGADNVPGPDSAADQPDNRRRYRRHQWPDSPAWGVAGKLWVLTAVAIAAAALWWNVRQFTTVVVMSVLLAYILNPAIVRASRRMRGRRSAGALAVYSILAVGLVLLPVIAAPGLLGPVLRADIPQAANEALDEVFGVLPTQVTIFGRAFDFAERSRELEMDARAGVDQILGPASLRWLAGYATDFAFTLIALLVTFFVSLYLAMDAPGVLDWIRGLVPSGYLAAYDAILEDIEGVWHQFFRGQLLLMAIVGSATVLGLVVLGVPYALVLGLLAGVLEVVPRLGPVLATLPAMIVALVSTSSTVTGLSGLWLAVGVLVLYVLIQQAENNILVPRILGGSVNLHPAVVLVAALAGAQIAGIVGIILAAPVLGSARVVGSWIYHQLTRPTAKGRASTGR